MSSRSDLVVVVDTRERRPYVFEKSIVRALPAGDYSVLGHEEEVAIERKTLSDAYSSLGWARERFEREIGRLANYQFAAIVIECSLPDFLHPPQFSRLNPRSAIGTLLSWNVKYGVHVLFAGDRAHAQAVTLQLLTKFVKYREAA